jgi:hypothetical protein
MFDNRLVYTGPNRFIGFEMGLELPGTPSPPAPIVHPKPR